jgi:L-ascorbate metabolism protein UlaG (beta-lactamase superfamily)
MARVHMGPDEAIRAHEILGAKMSVAIHHGTFQLADESIDTPAEQLNAHGKPDSFLVLRNGESIDLPE